MQSRCVIVSVFVFLILTVAGNTFAQDREGQARKGADISVWKTYGDGVSLQEAIPLGDLLETTISTGEDELLIEGIISDACQNKGCWMVISSEENQLRVEFKDYQFFVPWGSEGKRVRVQGRLQEKKITADVAKHMAEEMVDPPVKREKIKDEQTIRIFLASGLAIEAGGEITPEQLEIIGGKKVRGGHKHEHHAH